MATNVIAEYSKLKLPFATAALTTLTARVLLNHKVATILPALTITLTKPLDVPITLVTAIVKLPTKVLYALVSVNSKA